MLNQPGGEVRRLLETSQDFAQKCLDVAGVILVAIDCKGDIALLNRKGYEVLGHPPGSLLGRNWFQTCLPSEVREEVQAVFHRLLAGEMQHVERVENCVLTRSGEQRIISWHNTLLHDSVGRCIGTLSSGEDITERRQAEQALAAAAAEWSVCFNSMADGVSIHAADHTVINVNESLCQLLGKTKAEIIGKPCFKLFHDQDVPVGDCPLEKTRQSLHKEYAEFFEPRLGRWLGVSTAPIINGDGTLEKLVHVVRDMTERKRFELELATARDQAEAANRAKSQFLANISHEIRTPMTAILGYAELLLTPNLPNNEHADYVQTIVRNGKYLLNVINDLLDLSKIEAGKMTISRVDCSLRELVEEVRSVVEVRAREKGLTLTVEYADYIPEWIHTDPMKLRQILINLAGNAVKFTDHGSVRIRVSKAMSRPLGKRVRFDITDTGIGIEPHKLAELFQPFTQIDASATRRHGGTGLGLAISKHLADLLGGTIDVRSELGRGSTFTLTIDA